MATSFRSLVETDLRKGCAPHEAPKGFNTVAVALGVTLQYLYTVMNGSRYPTPDFIAAAAKRFGTSERTVQAAVDCTYDSANGDGSAATERERLRDRAARRGGGRSALAPKVKPKVVKPKASKPKAAKPKAAAAADGAQTPDPVADPLS